MADDQGPDDTEHGSSEGEAESGGAESGGAESGGARALTRGLDVLRALAESAQPLSATDLARLVGLHPSWVSRVLRALIRAGYARKIDYRTYAADYGALALGGNALTHFPLAGRTRAPLALLAQRSGLHAALGLLWRDQLIYLGRAQAGQETVPLAVGFPLHLSSIALRLLLERPEAEALAALASSRHRYGWDRPTPRVPESEAGVLEAARAALRGDVLALAGWHGAEHLGCAVPVRVPGEPVAALALSAGTAPPSHDSVAAALREGRDALEAAAGARGATRRAH